MCLAMVVVTWQVHLFTSSAIKRLQAKDQQLPQVQRILEMARCDKPTEAGSRLGMAGAVVSREHWS